MPNVLIAAAVESLPAATRLTAPLTLFLQALVLIVFVDAVSRIARRIVAYWQLERFARRLQIVAVWLCAGGLAVTSGLLILPRLRAGHDGSIGGTFLAVSLLAALVTCLTAPLAWRGAIRLLRGDRTLAPVRVGVPIAHLAALCPLSLAAAIAIGWAGRQVALPEPCPLLQLAFSASFLLTLSPAWQWLKHQLRPLPTA